MEFLPVEWSDQKVALRKTIPLALKVWGEIYCLILVFWSCWQIEALLKSKVIGVRDFLGAWHSWETRPSLSHTFTIIILHLNQCWLASPAGLGGQICLTMIAWSCWLESSNLKLLMWEKCWGHGTAGTPIHHSLIYLQYSYYIWTSVD